MKKKIELVQAYLKKRKAYNGKVDGLMGPNTRKGLAVLEDGSERGNWSINRRIIAAIQVLADELDIPAKPIDGRWGPITEEAFNQLTRNISDNPSRPFIRAEDIEIANPNNWPQQYTQEFEEFYGRPGEKLAKISLPYTHNLSWKPYTAVNRFSCHQKVAESMEKVLVNVLDHYGLDQIKRLGLNKWGGCFNIRKIRGGSKMSMHSWGIASDYDPTRNKLKWHADKATFADPVYKEWWQFWEDEGWVSLGRQRNYDWMHVQAARLKT